MVRFTFAEEDEDLVVEEEILWQNRQSWREFFFSLVFGFVLLFFYGLGLIVILYVMIERFRCLYIVTSYRAVCETGILSRDISEIDILDTRDMSIHQSLWQRLLKTGDVELSSAGRPGAEVIFKGVKYPEDVIDIVRQRKREIQRELYRESNLPDLEADE
jgi:uncharacterized membrane protein YdbT with pleckstrin-like domain